MRPDLKGPLRLAGIYLLFSTLWIFGSDYLLHTLVNNSALVAGLQTTKAMLFVLLSTTLVLLTVTSEVNTGCTV